MGTARQTKVSFASVCALALVSASCSGDDDDGTGSGGGMFGNADPNANGGQTTAGSGGLPGGGCASGNAHASRVVPRVILVVDGSCSMSTEYPSNGGQSATECRNNGNSRWAALRNALLDPQDGVVPRLDGLIEFGLVVFGTQPNCPLTAEPINPARDNFGAIDSAIGGTPPGMFTPTGPALDYVYENMILGQQLDRDPQPEIVILATDGEPNSCDNADPTFELSEAALMKGSSLGVTTHVISLANASTQFQAHLQLLADIGGGQLYEPTTPEQLSADLEVLVGGAVGCDLALNGSIFEDMECMGTVTLNGQPVACNDENGWTLIDSRHIRLQGEACDRLMQSPDTLLEARFPCGVFMVD